MPARGKNLLPAKEPWWAKYILTLIRIVLAFALAVLTLILTNPVRRGSAPAAPPALQDASDDSLEDDKSAP